VSQEGSEKVGLALERPRVATSSRRELIEIEEGQVRKRVELQVTPDVLDGIEFGRIRWKELGRELRVLDQKVLNAICTVGIEPVPDENHRRIDLRLELAEETDDTLRVDVRIRVEAKVEADVAAIGGDAQGPDGGYLAMRAAAVAERRRFAPRTPGAPHERRHHQATLVEEREPGLLPGRFFLMRGQSSRTHPWMRCSFRSAARRWGRCGLQPSERSNRPMWSG